MRYLLLFVLILSLGCDQTPSEEKGVDPSQSPKTVTWLNGSATIYGKHDECEEKSNPGAPGPPGGEAACGIFDELVYYAGVGDLSYPLFLSDELCQEQAGSMPSCEAQGSCNWCVEIRCVEKLTSGSEGCYGNNDTLILKIVDACPHNHPANQGGRGHCTKDPDEVSTHFSVEEWRGHIDVGCKAMKEIAPLRYGEWAIQFRMVNCRVGVGLKPAGSTDPFGCSYDETSRVWTCPP